MLNLKHVTFLRNFANNSGGAIYCEASHVTLEEGNLFGNCANLSGSGIFGDNCQVTVDQIKITNNAGLIFGGGWMYFKTSEVEIHITEGNWNTAGDIGNFVVITKDSKFQSIYLKLLETPGNCIAIFNRSKAEMKHTYLSDLKAYCPIIVRMGSDIFVDSVYSTDQNNTSQKQVIPQNTENIVDTDGTGETQGSIKGILLFLW